MSETVAAAGNGQSFLDELKAAAEAESAAGDLDTRARLASPEERGAPPDGANAPPWPPPAAPQAGVNWSPEPPSRPPTKADIDVRRDVMDILAEHGVKLPKPKAPKPERQGSTWSRVPIKVRYAGVACGTLLVAAVSWRVAMPAYPDVDAIEQRSAMTGAALAQESMADQIADARAKATQVVVAEPFAEYKPAELTEIAKSTISYTKDTNYKTLVPERAEIVAAQLRQLLATGKYKLADFYLTSSGQTDLRVIDHAEPGAVLLFKPAPTTSVTAPTVTPTSAAGS